MSKKLQKRSAQKRNNPRHVNETGIQNTPEQNTMLYDNQGKKRHATCEGSSWNTT